MHRRPEASSNIRYPLRSRLLQVAAALRDRLIQLNPGQASSITAQHAQFSKALADRIPGWEAKAARLKGKSVLTQHATFGYVWEWLGIKSFGDLEPWTLSVI